MNWINFLEKAKQFASKNNSKTARYKKLADKKRRNISCKKTERKDFLKIFINNVIGEKKCQKEAKK